MTTVRLFLPSLSLLLLSVGLLLLSVACQAPAGGNTDAKNSDGSAKTDDGMVWTSRAYPTGDRKTSALLVERGMPAIVQAGQRYEYEIRLTNLTDMVLVNVVVSDTAPAALQTPEGSPAPSTMNGSAIWHVKALEANATQSIRASGLAKTEGSFRHIAQVTYDAPLAGTTRIVQPRLELVRTVPEMVVLVDGISITYEVKNAGTGVARDVVIMETLPEGYTVDDGSDAAPSNVIRIDVGALGAGDTKTIERKIKATGPGAFACNAKVTGFGGLAHETAKQTVKVTLPKLRGKAEAPARAAIGKIYTLTLTIGNDGDGPAHKTTTTLKLPEGTAFMGTDAEGSSVRVVDNTLTWTAGSIEAGTEQKLAVSLRADAAAQSTFAVSAQAHGAEDLALDTQIEQYGIATVGIDVRDELDPLQAGTDAVYLVTVRNQGTAVATNIRIVCKLEEGMTLVSATGPSEGEAVEATIVFKSVEELAAKGELTWRIVVKGETAGSRRFHVQVEADQLERPDEASESTRFFE